MDLSNFKSILQNNKQDLKKRIQMEKTYIENEYYDFVYQNKPTGCYLMVQFLKGNNLFFYLFMILILVWNVDIWSKDLENNTFRYLFTNRENVVNMYIYFARCYIFLSLFFFKYTIFRRIVFDWIYKLWKWHRVIDWNNTSDYLLVSSYSFCTWMGFV